MVLSEALSNAIVRGNREDRGKWVDVRAELGPDAIRVSRSPTRAPASIPRAVPEPIHPEQLDEANGRGLYLIRKLVDAVQFNEQGKLHLHDTAPSVGRLELVLDSLGALVGGRVRLWRFDGRALRLAAGTDPGWSPAVPRAAGLDADAAGHGLARAGRARSRGSGSRSAGCRARARARPRRRVLPAGRRAARRRAAARLPGRGAHQPLRGDRPPLRDQRDPGTDRPARGGHPDIAREVSTVVGARRASIMVFDEAAGVLRTVAARGLRRRGAARRCGWTTSARSRPGSTASAASWPTIRRSRTPRWPTAARSRGYRGQAFLSVPICYGAPGSPLRCVGVINLTDRLGGDRFTLSDRKLVTAVANQIGAAVENARLVERDMHQQRLSHELELAHDLQLKLLPSPGVLQGDAEVAARCYPADSVGGDFYTFARLGRGRVGVMLGDVASHGFSAALVMALVMSAAGIHAAASVTPDETLAALLESLGTELDHDRDVLQRLLRRARSAHRPAVLRQRRASLCLSRPAVRRPRAARGHRPAARPGHGRQHRPPPGALVPRSRPAGPLDRRAGRRAERRPARRSASSGCSRTCARAAPSRPRRSCSAVLDEADAFGSQPTDDRTLLVMRI